MRYVFEWQNERFTVTQVCPDGDVIAESDDGDVREFDGEMAGLLIDAYETLRSAA
jgi:hypothetical protein